MDSQLRQLQRASQNGDPATLAQYWAALVRLQLIPKEYIWALSRVGNPAAVSLHPMVPKDEPLKRQIARFLGHKEVPERDIYDFTLILIDFLMQEWTVSTGDSRIEGPVILPHYQIWMGAVCAVKYLNAVGPDFPPSVERLQDLTVTLIEYLERSFDEGMPGLIGCEATAEAPLIIICCKFLHELKEDVYSFLLDHAPPSNSPGPSPSIEFYTGLQTCTLRMKLLSLPWKDLLERQIRYININAPWIHTLTTDGARMVSPRAEDAPILAGVALRFNNLIEHFFLERINNLRF